MDIIFGILVGILVLMTVVTIHEFGHFIVAKRNGVRVLEFGIGFPPRFKAWVHVKDKNGKWHWKKLPKSEWYEEKNGELSPKPQDSLIFSLNFLPIGGFCQMDGETNIDTRKGTFGAASLWSKTKILFAGVMMNWLLAFVIFTVLAWTGMPVLFDNQWHLENDSTLVNKTEVTIKKVVEDSPAEKAGLKENDTILSATDLETNETTEIESVYTLTDFNNEHAGKTVKYTTKDGEASVTLNNSDAEYLLGISMGQSGQTLYRSTWSAPLVGAVNTVQLTGETYRGIGKLIGDVFSGITSQFSSDENVRKEGSAKIEAAGDSVSGPVGIVGVLFPAIAQTGVANTLYLMAIISISLACMNVLPIPALDGGRWFLIALFRALKRPLTPETENKIVSRAFAFLLILAGLITVLDVIKIIS